MKFKVYQYPGKWRWRFALFPVWFGEKERLWLEVYQTRRTGMLNYERRDSGGNVVEYTLY